MKARAARTRSRLFAGYPDWRAWVLGGYFRKWVVLGVLIGVVAGVGAIAFFSAIEWSTKLFLGGITDLTPPLPLGEGQPLVTAAGRRWAIPVVTTLGGLLAGLIVFWLAPEAEGHGTDAAIDAFHERGGKIRARIPPIKLIASAITIGSGGSAGREGPTAQIAAGFGSWLGDIFRLSPQDRRIAVAAGIGAGIGAIFKAPLGGAILAAEILYIRDFEVEAIVPGFIASVVGYTIFGAWSGWTPVFGDGLGFRFDQPSSLVWYAVLGLLAGFGGIAYAKTFYATRDFFRRIRIPPHFKPAIGGLGVGLIALAFPQVLSMGYGWLQLAINGNTAQLAVGTMLALVALKIVATSLSIGSGGSGGVFAPGLFIGGMLGGGMWELLHGHVAWMPANSEPFVVVGMMALFGGVAKAPIAVILMVAQMTNELSMVVPAMMATTIAYLVSGNISIYESQAKTRADSPAHRGEYGIPLIQTITVAEAMRSDVITASPDETIDEAEERIYHHDKRGLPVIENERLVGMFTSSDALRARHEGFQTVREAMSRELIIAYPSDSLYTALQRMTKAGISRLPVVEREAPDRMVGIISTRDLTAGLEARVGAFALKTDGRRAAAGPDLLRSILVQEAMTPNFQAVGEDWPLRRVAEVLSSSGQYSALLMNENQRLTGIVTIRDLEEAIGKGPERPVIEIATRRVVFARRTQTIAEALAQPGAEGLRQLPVAEGEEGDLSPVGLLRRSDVLKAYLRGHDRQSRVDRRANLLADKHQGEVVTLELEISSRSPAVGKNLIELDLPPDAIITSVLRDGSVIIARGHVRLEPGDRVQILAAAGARDAVLERFHARSEENLTETGGVKP
jgi:chloride channel protein, CIC family